MNRHQMSKGLRLAAYAVGVCIAISTHVLAQDVNLKGNLNKFYKDVREDIKGLIKGAKVDSAVIFNDTQQPVTFFVYNYVDTVYMVSAQKSLAAPGRYTTVAASGAFYKIHPNDNKSHEFLVAPGKAYVYKGPGDVEEVKPQ